MIKKKKWIKLGHGRCVEESKKNPYYIFSPGSLTYLVIVIVIVIVKSEVSTSRSAHMDIGHGLGEKRLLIREQASRVRNALLSIWFPSRLSFQKENFENFVLISSN